MTSRARHLPDAALIATISALYGCSLFAGDPSFDDYVDTGGSPKRKQAPAKVELKMVFSYPKEAPAWTWSGVTRAPGEPSDLHFTGVSKQFATEQDARMDALRDAREQIAAYVVTDVNRQVQRVSVASGRSSEILDPGTVQEDIARLLSQTTLVGTASTQYYIQQWMRREDGAESLFWKAYALVVFPEKQNEEIRTAVLRSSAQRRIDQLEKLGEMGTAARVRNFEERLREVRRAMQEGRHVDAISRAQDLLDRLHPAEASVRRTDAPTSRPTPTKEPEPPQAAPRETSREMPRAPLRPSEAWRASGARTRGATMAARTAKTAQEEQAHVRSGLHATHRALEALSQDRLVHARKLLLDARSRARAAARRLDSLELRHQARLFDEFLKASVEQNSATVKADHRKSLEGLLESYWCSAAEDDRCPQCGAEHRPRPQR